MDPDFYLFMWLVSVFWFFFDKMQIGFSWSKKHSLALHKKQSGEPKFSFIILLGATCTKTWGQTSKYILLIYLTLLMKALPPTFHYSLDIFIFCYTSYEVKISLLGIYLLLYPIYSELYGSFFTNWIFISNFAYIATAKSRVSVEKIGIKVSALAPSWPLFAAIVLSFL